MGPVTQAAHDFDSDLFEAADILARIASALPGPSATGPGAVEVTARQAVRSSFHELEPDLCA